MKALAAVILLSGAGLLAASAVEADWPIWLDDNGNFHEAPESVLDLGNEGGLCETSVAYNPQTRTMAWACGNGDQCEWGVSNRVRGWSGTCTHPIGGDSTCWEMHRVFPLDCPGPDSRPEPIDRDRSPEEFEPMDTEPIELGIPNRPGGGNLHSGHYGSHQR